MAADPIASILAAQEQDGYWEKPGPGYATKYRGTVWQLIFHDQLGADSEDERVRRACEYVLSHSQAENGGFGAPGVAGAGPSPSSRVIHCLTGNLLRALIGFGWLDDPRLVRAVEWQARSITGEGVATCYRSGTSGPGFACSANEKLPCAWGAVKALGGLSRVPVERRSPEVSRAIQTGVDFLLSRDPAVADYPGGWGNTSPSGSWFKLGFPSGYVADVLQNLEVLAELGHAHSRLFDQSVVHDADVAFGDSPDGELRLPWEADLADDDDVERRTEAVGDLGGNGNATSRERDDNRPKSGVHRQPPAQLPTRITPILEHVHSSCGVDSRRIRDQVPRCCPWPPVPSSGT